MKRTAAAFIAALALAAPANAATRGTERYDQSFTLQPNTTATYRMDVSASGKQCNTLNPGWGLELQGAGVDLALGNFGDFWGGPLILEPERQKLPDGGVPGAQRHPDGTLWVPMPDATIVTAEHVRLGTSLRQVGWDWKRLDPWGNPKPTAGTARSAKAARRLRARRLRIARRKITGRIAQSGPVTVNVAGFDRDNGKVAYVAKVTTGALAGQTTLTLHASVELQPGTPSATPDGCSDG